jgi:hypothetical protein
MIFSFLQTKPKLKKPAAAAPATTATLQLLLLLLLWSSWLVLTSKQMPVTPLLLPPSSLHNKIPLWWSSIHWCSSKVYLAKFGDIQNIWIVENHEYLFKFSYSRQLWRFFCFFNFFSLSGELVSKTQGICDGIFPFQKKKFHKMAKACDQTKITASSFFFFVFLAFFYWRNSNSKK